MQNDNTTIGYRNGSAPIGMAGFTFDFGALGSSDTAASAVDRPSKARLIGRYRMAALGFLLATLAACSLTGVMFLQAAGSGMGFHDLSVAAAAFTFGIASLSASVSFASRADRLDSSLRAGTR